MSTAKRYISDSRKLVKSDASPALSAARHVVMLLSAAADANSASPYDQEWFLHIGTCMPISIDSAEVRSCVQGNETKDQYRVKGENVTAHPHERKSVRTSMLSRCDLVVFLQPEQFYRPKCGKRRTFAARYHGSALR